MRSREKKQRTGRKHESLKVWEYYEVKDGKVNRKRDHCPRCGPGTFLSKHDKRNYCGRCGYTHIQKKEEPKVQEPKEESEQA